LKDYRTAATAAPVGLPGKTENVMDRQRIEGGLKKATGSIKERAGKAIGDRHLEAEGERRKD
jgi:hypothetical protein